MASLARSGWRTDAGAAKTCACSMRAGTHHLRGGAEAEAGVAPSRPRVGDQGSKSAFDPWSKSAGQRVCLTTGRKNAFDPGPRVRWTPGQRARFTKEWRPPMLG